MDKNSDFKPKLLAGKRTRADRRFCTICGANASGINFDVLTCTSCKAFFRRNGVKPMDEFVCRLTGDCVISQQTRRQCTACRIRKCFSMGMSKERIRTQEQNQYHRSLIADNRRGRDKKRPSKSSVARPSTETNPADHLRVVYDLFLKITADVRRDEIRLASDADLTATWNLYSVPLSYFIIFIKQLAPFQCLTIDDKVIVLKNNTRVLMPMLTYLFELLFAIPAHAADTDQLNATIATSHSLFAHVIADDTQLLLLLIIVFLFCPCLLTHESLNDIGCVSQHAHELIARAYEQYAHLLWAYLLDRCRADEKQAAITYMKLISTMLRLQHLTSTIYDQLPSFIDADRLHLMIQSVLHLT